MLLAAGKEHIVCSQVTAFYPLVFLLPYKSYVFGHIGPGNSADTDQTAPRGAV